MSGVLFRPHFYPMAQSSDSPALLDLSSLESARGLRLAVVHTEWNEAIVAEQMRGLQRVLEKLDARLVNTIVVPGSFEIPFGCRLAFETGELEHKETPDAIVAFGAVIRGGTPHFDYVCKAVTEGVLQLNLMLPIPVIFGVLTLDTEAQAWERLGGAHGHKGEEAAIAALKMATLTKTARA